MIYINNILQTVFQLKFSYEILKYFKYTFFFSIFHDYLYFQHIYFFIIYSFYFIIFIYKMGRIVTLWHVYNVTFLDIGSQKGQKRHIS